MGIVAWWAVDQVIEWVKNLLGFGPAAHLARKVEEGLDRMESQLLNGADPGAMK